MVYMDKVCVAKLPLYSSWLPPAMIWVQWISVFWVGCQLHSVGMLPFYCVGLCPCKSSPAHTCLLCCCNLRCPNLLFPDASHRWQMIGSGCLIRSLHAAILLRISSQMVFRGPTKYWRKRAVAAGIYHWVNGDVVLVCQVGWWCDGGCFTGLNCVRVGMSVMGGVWGGNSQILYRCHPGI